MKPESGKSLSIWASTDDVPKFESLKNNIETEVCVIGAGITGITTAYLLAEKGKQVVVIDDGNICSGETARTTAHITNVIDDRYYNIESMHGEEASRLAAESQNAAIAKIKDLVKSLKIDCDFYIVDGYLLFGTDETDIMQKEFEAAIRAGINVEKFEKSPIENFETNPCLRFTGQAQFHILKYINGLVKAFTEMGGKIYTHTHASSIEDGNPVKISTGSKFSIKANDVIVATNSPISDYVKIHLKQAAYRTYVIGAKIPKGSIQRALYWDNEDPYHYVRIQEEENGQDAENYDVLIIGGEDHKTGQEDNAEERYSKLEEWGRKKFPVIGKIEYKWSGQVLEPFDGLSFIGLEPENSQHTYISTGDSGMGMTHGTFSAILLRDMILGKENKWSKIYDPKRITLRALGEMAKEGANTLFQYIDYVTPGDIPDKNKILPDDGAIVREGLHKIAVYKDKDGKLHEFSAECPHLKCILEWNSSEKTWDCPCHGSRFNPMGKVINGPAIGDMKKIEISTI